MLGALRTAICIYHSKCSYSLSILGPHKNHVFITSSYHNYYFALYILGILAEFNYYSMQSCIKAGLVIFGLFFSLISFWKRWTNPSFGYRYTTFVDSIFNVCSAQHNTIVELDLQIISFLQRKKNTIAIEQQQMSSNLMGNMWPVK